MAETWRDRDFLTPAEYAEIFSLSKNTVYARLRSGEIPSIKSGPRSIRIPSAHLKRLEEAASQ